MYKDKLVHEFNDEMWYLYHEGTINNAEEFQREKNAWINNKIIYRNECKEICGEGEAASNALYDLLDEHNDALTFNQMRIQND